MIAVSASPHQTAEWQCSRCGATNRKRVAADITVTRDRCVTCHARHESVDAFTQSTRSAKRRDGIFIN